MFVYARMHACSMYALCLTCCDLSNLLCPFQSETLAYKAQLFMVRVYTCTYVGADPAVK